MVPPGKINDIGLDAKQVTEALDESLQRTTLPEEGDACAKPGTAMVLREDDAKDLETLIKAVETLDPAAKQHFVDALVAKHYGVKRQSGEQKEVVPYADIKNELESVVALRDSLQQMIHEYWLPSDIKLHLNSKEGMRSLKFLVDASILDCMEVETYVSAVGRIHDALKKKSLGSDEAYKKVTKLRRSLPVCLGGTVVSLIVASMMSDPIGGLFFLGSVFVGGGALGVYYRYSNAGTSQSRAAALVKHYRERCQMLELDLEVASDYVERLDNRLYNPEQIDRDYLDRISEIDRCSSDAKKYLSYARDTFQRLNKKSKGD